MILSLAFLPTEKVVDGLEVLIANICPMIRVYMRCVTWSRDSHGLFDYESRNISKKNLKTKYVGKIVR